MALTPGTAAPDFTLVDQDRTPVSRDDLKGRKSLIVFIPFPFTGTCEGELCLLRDRLAELADLDANVVAITCDTVPSNKQWSDQNGFGFRVLSDFWPHGDVAKAYDTFNEKLGIANRTTYVLDPDGVIRNVIASDALGTPREYGEYVDALNAM